MPTCLTFMLARTRGIVVYYLSDLHACPHAWYSCCSWCSMYGLEDATKAVKGGLVKTFTNRALVLLFLDEPTKA